MRARFAPEVEAFRAEVRSFLRDTMDPTRAHAHADPRDLTGLDETFERAAQHDAGARGYLAVTVPTSMGGGGRSSAFRAVFGLEAAAFDAPVIDTALTLGGAPILAFGSAEQQATLLPAMIRGDILLCIAYTEADAGSDLANITTTARPTGDGPDAGWVIDGTKVLVTAAHKADWCLLVARTDPDAAPRKAMTMFLVELTTPGVTVRRVPTANGWTLNDIDWRRFDAGKVSTDLLKVIKTAAMVERNGADYGRYLCNVFKDDPEFRAVAAAWAAEEDLPKAVEATRKAGIATPMITSAQFTSRYANGVSALPTSCGAPSIG